MWEKGFAEMKKWYGALEACFVKTIMKKFRYK